MLLTKLNAMSIGPLWVSRTREETPCVTLPGAHSQNLPNMECCPVCGEPWIQSNISPVIAVLATPLSDEAQQKLLENCLAAAGWDVQSISCFSLHTACSSDVQHTLFALQEQISRHSPKYIIVFGHTTAQLMSSDFIKGQLNQFANVGLIVTHHPEEMIQNPTLKAQVWADLCLTKLDSE